MAHDVFISYATKDGKAVADAACAMLEGKGIRCWYAPRASAGDWLAEMMNAIASICVMIVVLSRRADTSVEVLTKVNVAPAVRWACLRQGIP